MEGLSNLPEVHSKDSQKPTGGETYIWVKAHREDDELAWRSGEEEEEKTENKTGSWCCSQPPTGLGSLPPTV